MKHDILFPVFAQIALTFVLFGAMAYMRLAAVQRGEIHYQDAALDGSRWPDACRKFANCYANQFEAPILFYVLCLAAALTGHDDLLMIILAWCFFATRIVHAFIFTGSNIVIYRGLAFAAGMAILMLMTAVLLFREFMAA